MKGFFPGREGVVGKGEGVTGRWVGGEQEGFEQSTLSNLALSQAIS